MPIIRDIDRNSNLMGLLKTQARVTTLTEDDLNPDKVPIQRDKVGKKPEVIPLGRDESPVVERPVDRTLIDGGYWERGTFTVPEDVSHERVMFYADKYKARLGKVLNLQGFVVKEMLPPQVTTRFPEPERRRYDILAFVTRKPMTLHVDIPDFAVPEMQKIGLKLAE